MTSTAVTPRRLAALILPVCLAGFGVLAAAAYHVATTPHSGHQLIGIAALTAAAILAERFPVPISPEGGGVLSLTFVFAVAAIVLYGWAVGALSITGDYTQFATGTLNLRVRAAANLDYDRVYVTGTASLAGTLRLTPLGGFAPAQGDAFEILTYANVGGDFETYDLPMLNAPRTWAPPAPGATDLTLRVQ